MSKTGSATYTDIEMNLAGEGNIHEEPQFADPAHDDFHLLSESPCIDAGSNADAPAADFEGEPRPADGNGDGVAQADMGADELVPGYAEGWHFPLDYGPYRAGQAPGGSAPSPQQIGQDMEIMASETRLIRTYGACPAELATIPPIAAYHDIAVYQGVNLGTDDPANDAEIVCYGALAAANANIAAGMVGGETLHFGWLTETELVGYLNQARTVAPLPVTTAEPWNDWCKEANAKPR